jgi:hypothetical protein
LSTKRSPAIIRKILMQRSTTLPSLRARGKHTRWTILQMVPFDC